VFGIPRKNGVRHHDDWVGRVMHKQCYKELLKGDLIIDQDLSPLQLYSPPPLDKRQRTLLLNPLRLAPLKEQEPEPELVKDPEFVKELKPDREKKDVA
jgi:hypothetical protein